MAALTGTRQSAILTIRIRVVREGINVWNLISSAIRGQHAKSGSEVNDDRATEQRQVWQGKGYQCIALRFFGDLGMTTGSDDDQLFIG